MQRSWASVEAVHLEAVAAVAIIDDLNDRLRRVAYADAQRSTRGLCKESNIMRSAYR
jgi:hypothetical protein